MNKELEQGPTVYMDKEEAVAAIKQYDAPPNDSVEFFAPNTEIKLEELVRLTFRNLTAERQHFYSAPVFTAVESRLHPDGELEDWVELSVMVKESAIGLILERLERIGVGSSIGMIAIYKVELCRTADLVPNKPPALDKLESTGEETSSINGSSNKDHSGGLPAIGTEKIEAARAEWKNAASRLRVEQVKEQIHEQAKLSLDYLALLAISSILAAIGLITNSTVVIVASMLVSPIMGPVMGMVSIDTGGNACVKALFSDCFEISQKY
jgi:hypothetical protein